MPDPIAPLSATSPAEVVALVSLALSDGDLGAALAQYEPGAVLQPWAPGAPAVIQSLTSSLAQLMELRLPLSVTVCDVLTSSEALASSEAVVGGEAVVSAGFLAREYPTARGATGLVANAGLAVCPVALVLAERRIAGTGPDCKPVDLCGFGATAARRQPDGSWRIVADAWRLSAADGASPAL